MISIMKEEQCEAIQSELGKVYSTAFKNGWTATLDNAYEAVSGMDDFNGILTVSAPLAAGTTERAGSSKTTWGASVMNATNFSKYVNSNASGSTIMQLGIR